MQLFAGCKDLRW